MLSSSYFVCCWFFYKCQVQLRSREWMENNSRTKRRRERESVLHCQFSGICQLWNLKYKTKTKRERSSGMRISRRRFVKRCAFSEHRMRKIVNYYKIKRTLLFFFVCAFDRWPYLEWRSHLHTMNKVMRRNLFLERTPTGKTEEKKKSLIGVPLLREPSRRFDFDGAMNSFCFMFFFFVNNNFLFSFRYFESDKLRQIVCKWARLFKTMIRGIDGTFYSAHCFQ